MRKSAVALVLGWVLTACVSEGRVVNVPYRKIPMPGTSEATRTCFDREATQAYLQAMHRRVIEAWEIAYGTPRHEVVARMTMGPDGSLRDAWILQAPDAPAGDRVLTAIEEAQPFGPVPPAAACLHEEPLVLRFRTQMQ